MQRGASAKAQEVTDSEGRRRFHGAFTGGFSAGYFNSVGSKEGWQPTAFSSSRQERAPASRFQQRAEDFMDEEDDPLLGRRLETTERYDTLQAGAKRTLHHEQQFSASSSRPAPIPGFALPDEWVLPANNSVGVALLRRMGWKEGQGIGQRVRKRRADATEGAEEGAEAAERGLETPGAGGDVLLPPRNSIDVKTAFPQPKVDRYGAGFDPFASAPEFARYKQQQQQQNSRKGGEDHRQIITFADAMKPTTGSYRAVTGYGLGALEDNDDLDVYGGASMAEFDTEIGPARIEATKQTKLLANASEEEEEASRRRRRLRTVCSDGRKPLPGFELAQVTEKPPKAVSERLQVPADFKPFHTFGRGEDGDQDVSALYRQHRFSTMQHGRSTSVTVRERAALLGTSSATPDAGTAAQKLLAPAEPAGSVFGLMRSSDKQKLMEAVGRAKAAAIASAARSTSSSVLGQPPATVEAVGVTERQPLVQGSSSEQLRATISASIAKRFVSSSVEGGDVTAPPPGDSSAKGGSSTSEELDAVVKRSYRSQSPWVPSALLCKRFHVKCAGMTSRSGDGSEGDRKPDLFAQELVPQLVEFAASRSAAPMASPASVASRGPTRREEEKAELPPLPEVERPAASLLKSIFEPSDESASEEETSDDDQDSESEDAPTAQTSVARVSVPDTARVRGRRGAADYFSSDSSSEEDKAAASAPQAAVRGSHVVANAASIRDDSGSDSERSDELKRKKRRKRRRDDEDDEDGERKASRKRSKKHKKHKKDKKHKKLKHRESSKTRTRSYSPSPSRTTRKHRRHDY